MTAQEQQMLQDLTSRINSAPLTEKDPEAEQYLRDTLGRNPDALYILAQTTLVQGYALEQAQKQLADARAQLQQQSQQPKHSGSFLGNLLGIKDDPAPPPPPPQQPQYTPVPNYPPSGSYYAQGNAPQYGQPQYGQPQYGQQQYAPAPAYGAPQSGSFLRSAMTTATGVAAGALAFEGIESLMHGFGEQHSGGRGFEDGGRPEEVVNNYYGDASARDRGGLSSDIEDRRGDSPQFADSDGGNIADTSNSGDDFATSNDDSSSGDDFTLGDDNGSNDTNY